MDAHAFLTGLWIHVTLGGAKAASAVPALAPATPTHAELAFASLAAGLLLLLVCVVVSGHGARGGRLRSPPCSST